MKHTVARTLTFLALIVPLGCLEDPANIEDDFEGLSGAEEVPEPGTIPTSELADADVVRIRALMLWGYLRPRPSAEVVHWSGQIGVTNAGLRVLRTVRFEPGDRILEAQSDLKTVTFVSRTAHSADGLLLEIVMRRGLDPVEEPVVLTFASGLFTWEMALEPGMRAVRSEPVDEAGHSLTFIAFGAGGDVCREGIMLGSFDNEGKHSGRMKGQYFSGDGSLMGKIRGLFGRRANGAQVFVAKVTGAKSTLQAALIGRYEDGRYAGLAIGGDRRIKGLLRGLYGEGPVDDGGGFFVGRWSHRCREVAGEGTEPGSGEPDLPLED